MTSTKIDSYLHRLKRIPKNLIPLLNLAGRLSAPTIRYLYHYRPSLRAQTIRLLL